MIRLWTRASREAPAERARLVVGLGNPGRRYENTRHNVGFQVIDALATRHDLQMRGAKQKADVAHGSIHGVSVLLAQPVTYMNESGLAVQALSNYFRIPRENLLIVCDDIDLPFGTLRFRATGSSGGQRGLQSIIQSLGTSSFARLRLGVGRPEHSAVGHVLGTFEGREAELLPTFVGVACDAVEAWLTHDLTDLMNRFNRNWLTDLESGAAAGTS